MGHFGNRLDRCVFITGHKEINLPVTVVIPIYYKFKLRQLLKNSRKDPLHLYIMLKQRKSWLNLESTECKQNY